MIKLASSEIYKELINGRVINKHQYIDGLMQANDLYDEIYSDLEAYRKHYDMIGFELADCGDSYYLRDLDSDRYKDTAALKIQALLLIISRFSSSVGTLIDALKDYRSGISRSSLKLIEPIDEVKDILKACGMDGTLVNEIEKNLIVRGVGFWNQNDGLVLTDGGQAIFNSMFQSTQVSFEKDL
ncbi:MAG: hypothetical protein WCY88_06550 [Spongiibacteraceae bacterium]